MASLLAFDRLGITCKEALLFDGGNPVGAAANKPYAHEVREARAGALAFASGPLHVMVAGKSLVNPVRDSVCHLCSTGLPSGSFVRVSGGLLLCSPELCFLQMAALIPFHALVKLGFELCGLYTLQPDGRAEYQRVLPPTTVSALSAYLERRPRASGVATARKALRYVAVASGSPMETAMAVILCLPLRLGGYGLPLPRMNYRIDAPRSKGHGWEKSYYLCDLYWPDAHIGVEYDSDLEHTGPIRIAEDARRRNDLASRGITTITATREQVMDGEGFDRIARQLAKRLNVRIRSERGWSLDARQRLFRSLVTTKDVEASWTKTRRFFICK